MPPILPFIQPALQPSGLIRQLGEGIAKATKAQEFERAQWGQFFNEKLKPLLGEKNSKIDQDAYNLVEGSITEGEAHPRAVEAAGHYRRAMGDFATRLGLEPWANYATKKTNMDTLYSAFRDEFFPAEKLGDLSAGLRFQVKSHDNFRSLKDMMMNRPDWSSLTGDQKKQMKELWNFQHLSKWESLPSFITRKAPKELFSPYLLKRTENDLPYEKSLQGAFQSYVPSVLRKIHFDPILNTFQTIIDKIPSRIGLYGKDSMFSEKGYAQQLLDREVRRLPAMDELALGHLTDSINRVINKEIINPEIFQAGASMLRSGFYRGTIGLAVDTGLTNLTQSALTWAHHGNITKHFLNYVTKYGRTKEYMGLLGSYTGHMSEDPFRQIKSPMIKKVLEVDQAVNRVFLSNMAITESVNRGINFWAGLEEAIKLGLDDHNEALVNAYAKASKVVPNLQATEAQMHAIFRAVPKSQFGAMPGQFSPYFRGPLGRLSTVFITYPSHLVASMATGFAEGLASSDKAKVARFLAASGAFVGLPYVMSQVGMDVRNMFGMDSVLGNMNFPFYQAVINGYRAVMGQRPLDRKKAQKSFQDFTWNLVPAHRYGAKVKKVYENINRGYSVDGLGRMMYHTTPMGEVLRLAGIPPEKAYDQRALTEMIYGQAEEHANDKREALSAFVKGDKSLAEAYMKKWNRQLTMEDVQRFQQSMMQEPQQRALQRMPKDLRSRFPQAREQQ